MIPDTESVPANASETIRNVTVRQNRLTTFPKACCMLPDGQILLLYTSVLSDRLIKLEIDYNGVGFCNLDIYWNVTGVCYLGNNTAVVCGYRLLIYVDVGSMTVKKTSNTDVKSKSIACNNKLLYVLGEENVHTYTVNGKRLSQIYINSDEYQPYMFWDWYFQNIAVSDDGSKIYIITSDDKRITIDSLGNHLNTLQLSDSCCICVDESGNVWVGSLLKEVYLVSADGARILHTISDGEDSTLKTICYDRTTSSLITISENKLIALKFNSIN